MINWTPLRDELTIWDREGLALPLWWRDDDAVRGTPALRQLTDMGARAGLPVHIAVIPAHADASLADRVADGDTLVPLVHGWAHENHAGPDQKKAEFGAHRPVDKLADAAADAHTRLRTLFGDRLQPVFVPPWNRISPDLVLRLPGAGYEALSTFTPRSSPYAAPGLAQINTHIDPIDWRGTRGLVDPDKMIPQIITLLEDRRQGRADATEPLGLLTHHLVHDAAIWSFCAELIDIFLTGPATAWSFALGDQHEPS